VKNAAKYLDTDEDGNRMSILPDKQRPSSSSKKDQQEEGKGSAT